MTGSGRTSKKHGKAVTHPLSKNKIELLASIVVFAIIIVLFSLMDYNETNATVPQDSQEPVDGASVSQCMTDNPGLTQQDCDDMENHDNAIKNNDESLCEKIASETTRDHCLKFFR